MKGDQSFSPFPKQKDTALEASSSVRPNIPPLPCLPCSERFEGVARDMDLDLDRDLDRERRREGVAEALDLSLSRREFVLRPYRTPRCGVASTGGID